ncbi:MAG: ribonuclease HII [Candidatus Sumerlaeia bacterium]|nr:ribonuclease HII [Candidatus Sumerlaeia bacterium]
MANGGCLVAGIDEAGRGPIAGPVVAAAVVWDPAGRRPVGLADSKLLTARQRQRLNCQIRRRALAWGIGLATAAEIDLLNILEATRLAAMRALEALGAHLPPGHAVGALVTDALELPACSLPTHAIIKGDQKSASIAAASILAKETRDRIMDDYHLEFPEYGWDNNRGYPTDAHRAAVEHHGPCTLHRLSFAGVDFFCSQPRRAPSSERLERLAADTPPTPEAVRRLLAEADDLVVRLPPPDFESLARLLNERVAAAGLPPWDPPVILPQWGGGRPAPATDSQ